jgi:hypothetical protein
VSKDAPASMQAFLAGDGILDDLFTPPPPPDKPHHLGHRDRLRERAKAGGLGALPDYELLELYLFRSIPMKDTKPLAKALLARFGDLAAVLAASVAELRTVAGVGEGVALDLTLLHEATLRIGRAGAARRTVITSWSQLLAYVRVALAHEPREQFRVLFLDKNYVHPVIMRSPSRPESARRWIRWQSPAGELRIIQRVIRNCISWSGGRYRPGAAVVGCSRLSARSFMARSA